MKYLLLTIILTCSVLGQIHLTSPLKVILMNVNGDSLTMNYHMQAYHTQYFPIGSECQITGGVILQWIELIGKDSVLCAIQSDTGNYNWWSMSWTGDYAVCSIGDTVLVTKQQWDKVFEDNKKYIEDVIKQRDAEEKAERQRIGKEKYLKSKIIQLKKGDK